MTIVKKYHTWQAWRSRNRKKLLDHIMGPRDLRSTTRYLNRVRLRPWNHFPVLVKIEGKDLRVKKGAKGWAGWIPKSEAEKNRFQELVLPSSDGRVGTNEDEDDGWSPLQGRSEKAAAAVKATTTAVRNKNKFTVPDEIRETAAEAVKCRNPVRRKLLRKRAHKARREFEAGRNSGSTDVPAKTEIGGRRRFKPIVKNGMTKNGGSGRKDSVPKKTRRQSGGFGGTAKTKNSLQFSAREGK